jgi:endonuclease/exonuclease/phosphatase (EEP) superfamily protein YafD
MLNGLLYVTIAGGLLPLGARFWWGLEIFSHFRLQYLVLALPLLIVALWQKQPLAGGALFAIMAANVWPVLPDLPFSAAPKSGNRIVVLNMNVRARNPEHALVLERIRESGADIVTLIELSRELDLRLGELGDTYPHRLSQPRDDNFGLAVLSRHPLRESTPFLLGRTLALETVVDLPDGRLRVFAVHPVPPVGAALAGERNTALGLLAAKAREITGPLLVCGDFNLTPYSPHFGDFERASGLISARRGRGVGISWPSFMPLLGVPIDHCFLRAPLAAERVDRMARSGSDHYPVRVTLRWQGKP